jgi:hypothetical protein
MGSFWILFAGLVDPKRSYGIAMIVLAFMGLLGLGAALLLPSADPRSVSGDAR